MAQEVHAREQQLRQQLQQVLLDLKEREHSGDESIGTYIPMDRRQALVTGETLPERASGAAIFVDVCGFSAITEALERELGLQRGAEELVRHLNTIFDALIDEVHRFRGSVVSFGGDAMTAWFEEDEGQLAVSCALSMQKVMTPFASLQSPARTTITLALKAAVAAGPVRRMLVGDPDIQVISVLAGWPLDELALAEQLAEDGEVVVQETIIQLAGRTMTVSEWRTEASSGRKFAVVSDIEDRTQVVPWPEVPPGAIDHLVARPWLLPAIYERVRDGKSEFLAELRPAAVLFLGFHCIDFDGDDQAGAKLDAFVRWAQGVISDYDGSLLQVTVGDKGSYFYAGFGAPVAHQDDAVRAVAAALELQAPPPTFQHISGIRIGVTSGQMRAGAYGGSGRRTYGVHGSKTNLAAALMQHSPRGILCDEAIYLTAGHRLPFDALQPIVSKGSGRAVPVFRPVSLSIHGVISSDLDRLPPAKQLTLKVASVIGITFTRRLLKAIYPLKVDRPNIDGHLDALVAAGLIVQRSDATEPTFEFSDAVTRDQAYRLLLFAQRPQLHCSVAEWYERTYVEDLAPFYPLLAHHWDAADDPIKASTYFELAAASAREQGAAEEAARYFRASLALNAKAAVRP